jgi:ABC-type lipoprotein export system ATPase subunit
MPKHIIQTVNFNINQSEKTLISSLNWTVNECDWIEIEGQNNAGKTTLLDSIYGHHLQCSGQLYVLDFSLNPISREDLLAMRRKIGYAKQKSNLLKNKTLRANLAMVLNAADRVTELSIDELLRKEIQDLSMSEVQCAGIAKALVHRPKLVLLDQILENLDGKTRLKVINLIEELRDTERMTILSTTISSANSIIPNSIPYKLENGHLFIAN